MADLDLSILDRVKKRLYGADTLPTQNVPSSELGPQDTQVIPDFHNSILFTGDKTHDSTQTVNEQNEHTQASEAINEAIRLPQLALDDIEFAKPLAATQVIGPEDEYTTNLSREEKLALLVEKKRQERLQQEKLLEADISRASLTDEENELDDAADTTRDSSVQKNVTTKKELEQIERFLSEQKRNRTIQPAFHKKEVDPVKQLVAAFDSDSEPENPVYSDKLLKLSPTTSPIKVGAAKGDIDLDSDSDFDTTNVLDMIVNPKQSTPTKTRKNPLDDYAQRLKKQMFSSPTRSDAQVIALDDSGDETAVETNNSDIPKLSKEQQFTLKQRYSRKKLQKLKQNVAYSKFHQPRGKEKNTKLFSELVLANAKQLNDLKENNPDAELIEEIEKEEEEMGTLLEREMERVRRLRKKEKLQEKAKLALLNGELDDKEDADYKDQDDQEEVPDSDADSDASDYGSDDSENGLDADSDPERVNRSKRVVLSDDEEERDDEPQKQQDVLPTRNDDSYMFGGSSDEVERDDDVMQIQAGGNDDPSIDTISHAINPTDIDSHELFLNLAPRNESEVLFNQSVIDDSAAPDVAEAPSFLDLTETQDSHSHNLPTQADTQPVESATGSMLEESTQTDLYSDDDEEDLPTAVKRGRKLIRKNALESVKEDDEQEIDEEKQQELLKEKLALYEAKIRRKELKARKMRKDLERRGIKNVVEGEAEESEDEWKGIGGADVEDSDQADSEDEKMIDNDFNIDLNDEEVRKKFMEQYQIKDRKELEKLIDDIKNHKLTKRARANGFDIELSDEEDELLMAYRRQKLQEQKQRLLSNQKLMKLALNDKSKAFFNSIQDEIISIALDEDLDDSDTSSGTEAKPKSGGDSQGTEADELEVTTSKKVIKIGEAFVQRQLSFLSKTEDDSYLEIQRVSNMQHGVASDDDIEDLSTLKSRCLSNLYTKSATPEVVDLSNKRSRDLVETDEDNDDDDDCFTHVFKKPSVVGSFRSFQEKQGVQVSSKSFSGVTVNKQYKVASGSKASITYLSRANRQKQGKSSSVYQSSKTKEIEESIGKEHRQNSALFKSGGTFS